MIAVNSFALRERGIMISNSSYLWNHLQGKGILSCTYQAETGRCTLPLNVSATQQVTTNASNNPEEKAGFWSINFFVNQNGGRILKVRVRELRLKLSFTEADIDFVTL